MSGINLRTQVRRILRPRHGGTGTARGWGRGTVKVCINRTGSSLTLGTLVRLTHQFGDPRVEPTTTYQETTVLGVVVGWFDQDTDPDTLIEADSPSGTCQVGVLVQGTTDVRIGSEGATKGQYAYASTTDGCAASSGILAVGAFGIFQSGGSSGDQATLVLSGAVQWGAGAVTFASPAFTFGTAAAAGAASTTIRSDATLALFDATTPAAIGTAATGSAGKAARRDHVHDAGGGTPTTIAYGDAAGAGSAAAAARSDHRHGAPAVPELDDLADVDAASPAVGAFLAWDGAAWVASDPGSASQIWRPVLDADTGAILQDPDTGQAIMGYGPA